MELRNHPVMLCDGINVWPPIWLRTYGRGPTFVSGELGILEAVFLSHALSNNVYLLTHTEEGNNYVGTLLFADADSAKVVFGLLQRCINKTLTSIGSTDFPETLAN